MNTKEIEHHKLREKFGTVLPTDDAVQILEAVEQWLIKREPKQVDFLDWVHNSWFIPCNDGWKMSDHIDNGLEKPKVNWFSSETLLKMFIKSGSEPYNGVVKYLTK